MGYFTFPRGKESQSSQFGPQWKDLAYAGPPLYMASMGCSPLNGDNQASTGHASACCQQEWICKAQLRPCCWGKGAASTGEKRTPLIPAHSLPRQPSVYIPQPFSVHHDVCCILSNSIIKII